MFSRSGKYFFAPKVAAQQEPGTIESFSSQNLLARTVRTRMSYVTWLTLAIVALLFLSILYWLGVFLKVRVEVRRPPFGECTFFYKFYQGPYQKAGEAFGEVSKLAKRFPCVGIYFDDPEKVASDATCYAVGVFIEKEKTSSEDVAEISYSMKSVGYKWIEVPAISKAMCAIFPFKENFLAILVAVSKVYPAMRKYIQEHKIAPHPFLEFYKDGKIHFVAPLERCSEFYVPEYQGNKE